MSHLLLHHHSRTFSHHRHRLSSLIFSRPMGGGPRTFPGGLNKWQWKRLHEKKARDKEKRLLDQEKQLYQARLRSEIRASVSSDPAQPNPTHSHSPMSPRDQVRALADRFMKPGAEDLWNDADGPTHDTKPDQPSVDFREGISVNSGGFPGNVQQRRGLFTSAVSYGGEKGYFGNLANSGDCGFGNLGIRRGYFGNFANSGVEKVLDDGRLSDYGNVRGCNGNLRFLGGKEVGNGGKLRSYEQRRGYVSNVKGRIKVKGDRVNKRRYVNSSTDDDEENYGVVSETARWPRFTVEKASEEEVEGGRKGVRGFLGSGSGVLGKHDVKIIKKRVLNDLEDYAGKVEEDDDMDLKGKVEVIRQEVMKRKMAEVSRVEDGSGLVEGDDDFVASGKRFDECDISALTVKALTEAGYDTMSKVQEATLSVCLEGKDALVRARAGTGKTVAYLLPAIETVLKAINSKKIQRVPPIRVLILCPTRELASQIAAETRVLLKYHVGLGVQMLAGGTRFKDDLKRLESDPCQFLVATPGRLLDHIESRSAVTTRLMGLEMLVLDEADHLLDLGFRKDMEKIVDCIPRKRQSLLFSATIPKEVRRISQLVLQREHAFINVTEAGSPETNSKVKQSFIIAPHDTHFQIVYHLLREHTLKMPDYKAIVFCSTGMVTSLMYHLFREMSLNVRELHSRKPQLYRSRIAEEFKQAKRLILISSDVSARGMNYPDVSLVIQVGIPSDREQYIHRLGRTARCGKDGEGVLVLANWEEHFLEEIRDLPIERSSPPIIDQMVKMKMKDSMAKVDTSVKEAAYHAWLGYYNSLREVGRDKTSLVEWANQFSKSIGLQTPPALLRKTVVRMGLKGIPGIRTRN